VGIGKGGKPVIGFQGFPRTVISTAFRCEFAFLLSLASRRFDRNDMIPQSSLWCISRQDERSAELQVGWGSDRMADQNRAVIDNCLKLQVGVGTLMRSQVADQS
jgi:hypothetical protein